MKCAKSSGIAWSTMHTVNTMTPSHLQLDHRVQIPAKAFLSPTLATPTILWSASSEFPDGAIL